MRYILNSAVITSPGHYDYSLISESQAKDWLQAGPFDSTVGYAETASAMSGIFGMEIPVNRRQIQMEAGDEALVFRLTCRLDDPALKGRMSPEYVLAHCEMGLLRKEADNA